MVVRVAVSDNEWNEMKDNTLLTSRDVLSRKLFETCLKKEGSFPVQRMAILLPTTVSIRERHTIHKMTLKNMFESSSFDDENGERRMHIYMSKAFVYALLNPKSNLETIVEQDAQVETDADAHEDAHEDTHDAAVAEVVADMLTEVVTEVEKVGSEVTIDIQEDADATEDVHGATLEIVTEPAVDTYTVKVNVTDTSPIPNHTKKQKQSFFEKICQFVCRFGN